MSYNSISYCIVPATQARRHAAAVGREACASVRRAGRMNGAMRFAYCALRRVWPSAAARAASAAMVSKKSAACGGSRVLAENSEAPCRGDEAGVAAFPSLELAREEGAARAVVSQARQVRVDAGDETARAIRAAACGGRGGNLVLLSCSHPVSDPLQCAVGR